MINLFHSGGCHDSCCLKVQNVSVKIGGDKILKDVNLHVHCGQMVARIGPNGAGKSTLLKALLGEREFDGNIIFSAPAPAGQRPGSAMCPSLPILTPVIPCPFRICSPVASAAVPPSWVLPNPPGS